MLQDALTGNAKHHIYLGEETSIDHAWSILEEAYGDPQKRTYRTTPEASSRTLDIEAEYEEDVETLIDNARPTLEEAFQDPETHSHNNKKDMEATDPFSDTTPIPGMPNIPKEESDTMVSSHQTPLDTTPSNSSQHRRPSNAGEISPDHGPRRKETTSTQTKDK